MTLNIAILEGFTIYFKKNEQKKYKNFDTFINISIFAHRNRKRPVRLGVRTQDFHS